jgi:hypothetical protein
MNRIIMVERQSSEKLDITIYFWGLVCRYVGVSWILLHRNSGANRLILSQ